MGRYFLGKRVACLNQGMGGGGLWAEYMVASVKGGVLPLNKEVSLEQGAMSIINPLTAVADHLIFEDKKVEGFWMGPWIDKKNLIQIMIMWRRAQKLMAKELKSEIRVEYPLDEAKEAVQDYLDQMTGGKVLLRPGS
jgi:NADPH:quinone reductase-like Zn-dependent oxidoreductase